MNSVNIPIDTSQPNPNQTEFDNLYLVCDAHAHNCAHINPKKETCLLAKVICLQKLLLYISCRPDIHWVSVLQDMNGIIHPCFHPEDRVSIVEQHLHMALTALAHSYGK